MKRGSEEMKHSIRCNLCDTVTQVNGQKQIMEFARYHAHEFAPVTVKTGAHVSLDLPHDRITLKIDEPELITHR